MGAYSDRIIADGASYYWRLGETVGTTAVDAVGGANGTISGGVTLGAAGAIADGTTAMTFDGATGKVVTAGTVTVPVTVTVEAWLKLANFDDYRAVFSTRFAGANTRMFGTASNGLICYSDAATPAQVNSVAPLMVNTWYHAVFIHTGVTCTFYLNGVLTNAEAQAVGAQVPTPAGIGANPGGSTLFMGGLDDVSIYPRALTPAEIAAHYTLARQSVSWPGAPWWVQIGGEDALDSYNVWEPITPSNTVNLPRGVTGGIWVGGGGDVAAVMQNGQMPVVLAAVPTGAWLPMAAIRINSTGTTATGLVALYEA